jgi:hypothetical protein
MGTAAAFIRHIYQRGKEGYEVDVVTNFCLSGSLNQVSRSANVLTMSNIGHFPASEALYSTVRENQGSHPETDIIRSVYYLWCGYRGGV